MKAKNLIVLMTLIILGAGGFFIYKNIFAPRTEVPEVGKEIEVPVIEDIPPEEREENGEGKECPDDEICPQFSENVDCESKHFKMAFVLVAPSANDVTPERLNKLEAIKNEFSRAFAEATRNLASMDTSDDITVILAQDINVFDINKKFYEIHDDIYDFISIYYAPLPNLSASIQGHAPLVQNIKGIGSPLLDNSNRYWTSGKLKGHNIMGSIDMYRLDASSLPLAMNGLLHETGHQWCCYVGDNFARGEGGAKLEILWQGIHLYVGLQTPDEEGDAMKAGHWVPNNDGTYKNRTPGVGPTKYHPFVLYFMGLLPKEEYDIKFQIFDAGGIDGMWNLERAIPYKEVSVGDIIEVAGERVCIK